jgi:outer membrane lipoprotein-sorting protein
MDSLGWVYFRKGKYKEAEDLISKSALSLPDPVVWEHLGDVRLKLGQKTEAWDAYRKALELDPKNKAVKSKIESLEKLVLPKTLQRKMLKRAIGNLLQVKSLKTNFTISAKTKEINHRSFGIFQYSRPSKWRIDILGTFLAPQIIIIENKKLNIYPKALDKNISSGQLVSLGKIKEYFNTQILDKFDSEETEVDEKGDEYIYTLNNEELTIHKKRGFVSKYRKGNDIVLEFTRQVLFEGLYLPYAIEITLPKDGIYAEIKIQNIALNEDLKEDVFLPLENLTDSDSKKNE